MSVELSDLLQMITDKVKRDGTWYDVVTCDKCVFCKVYNNKDIYAVCTKFSMIFPQFGDDTRKNYCSWGERTNPLYTDCAWKEGE